MVNLIDLVSERARKFPFEIACTTLDSELVPTAINNKDLFIRVSDLATRLRESKIGYGDICMLVFPQGIEFIISFFACHRIGAIPVPLNMPSRNRDLSKWEKIAEDCDAKMIISSSKSYLTVGEIFGHSKILAKIPLVSSDITGQENINREHIPDGSNNCHKIAFLQYTSGSTGSPKGVIVSQASVIQNLEEMKRLISIDRTSNIISWIPFYHDMGLIGSILQNFYSGCRLFLMNPVDFMSRPLNWLKAISIFKGTHTSAPNFAYELIIKHLRKTYHQNLDFSLEPLSVAVSGSEPINLNTLLQFQKAVAKFGLKANTLTPAYGLAEATLIVSSTSIEDPLHYLEIDKKALLKNRVSLVKKDSLQSLATKRFEEKNENAYLVSNGKVIPHHFISIIDPQTKQDLGRNKIGEICFAGPSVTEGYWANPQETQESYTQLDQTDRTYLRTGDLGFLDDDQELYVTGRIKDLIIIQGANYYPQDIERTAFNAVESLRNDGAVAFSILREGQEKLVIVQEVERSALRSPNYGDWKKSILEAVLKGFGIVTEAILFVPPMHIPRTTSGKIQRLRVKSMYEADKWKKVLYSYRRKYPHCEIDLVALEEQQDQALLEELVLELVASELGFEKRDIDLELPFFELGINSMSALIICDTLSLILRISVTPNELLNYYTVRLLSQYLLRLKLQENQALPLSETTSGSKLLKNPEMNYDHCTEEDLIELLEEEMKS